MLKKTILTLGSLLVMTASAQAQSADTATPSAANDPANTVQLEMSTGGTVTIQLMPDIAPKHVERITTLAGQGFYDGIVFHRVIPGFMAQTGDPTGTGTGGSPLPDVPAEFSAYQYKRGTVGMARTNEPDTANSQFFICFTNTGCSFLTGQYTVVGQVLHGMEYIDKVAVGEPPATPDKIVKMTVGAAAPAAEEKKAEGDAAPAEATPPAQ